MSAGRPMLIWLLRLVSLAALAGFCAAVWYAGPMVGFGDARPLEPVAIRATIIGAAVGLVALYYGIRFWLARRAQMALEAAIADAEGEGGDASILKARMNDAIATLRADQPQAEFPLRTALVPRHRPAGRRQDDGAGQFGPEVPARRFGRGAAGVGRRRHALLRLVVHRGGGASSTPPAATPRRIPIPIATRRAGWPSWRC